MPKQTRKLALLQPSPTTLQIGDIELTDEILKKYEIKPEDMLDFTIALQVVELQFGGMSLNKAAEQNNISASVLNHSQHWIELLNKAKKFMAAPRLREAVESRNYLYGKWPDLIKSLVNVGLNGGRDHEKVAAIELLHQMFPETVQEPASDDTAEKVYLRKPKNFDPQALLKEVSVMQPIQVNEGGTIIINQTQEKKE